MHQKKYRENEAHVGKLRGCDNRVVLYICFNY